MSIALNSSYVYRRIYGQALLIPITKEAVSGNMISLNETAESIILHCSEYDTIEELTNMVVKSYTDAEKYRNDVYTFIQKLFDNKILIYEGSEK